MKKLWLFICLVMEFSYTPLCADPAPSLLVRVVCSRCGAALTPADVQLHVQKRISFKKALCLSCWILRGKDDGTEDKETSISPVSIASSGSAVSGVNTAWFIGDSDYYGGQKLEQSATEAADWEDWDSFPSVKKKLKQKGPKKVLYGQHPVNFTRSKKAPKKSEQREGEKVVQEEAALASSQLFPFHLPRWWYFFPQRPDAQKNSELQVFYDDQHVFGTVSEHPAQELWCQGPRAVIMTDDGYTFFDMEKKERRFFKDRNDLDTYAAQEGITYEFKVMLQEEKASVPASPITVDSSLDRISSVLDMHGLAMKKFSDREQEYQRNVDMIDQQYRDKVSAIMADHQKRTGTIIGEYEKKVAEIEKEFSKMTVS